VGAVDLGRPRVGVAELGELADDLLRLERGLAGERNRHAPAVHAPPPEGTSVAPTIPTGRYELEARLRRGDTGRMGRSAGARGRPADAVRSRRHAAALLDGAPWRRHDATARLATGRRDRTRALARRDGQGSRHVRTRGRYRGSPGARGPSSAGRHRRGRPGWDQLNSAATSAAISAVLRAAPLRRLSPQTNSSSVFGKSRACRIRPTYVGSVPTTSAGVGNTRLAGSSSTTTVGAASSTSRAPSTVTSRSNVAWMASECVVTTGTRTQVAETFRSGMPRIFRDSLRTLSSSDDQPSSLSEPAHGTTLSASGAGNGESARSGTALRTSPATV